MPSLQHLECLTLSRFILHSLDTSLPTTLTSLRYYCNSSSSLSAFFQVLSNSSPTISNLWLVIGDKISSKDIQASLPLFKYFKIYGVHLTTVGLEENLNNPLDILEVLLPLLPHVKNLRVNVGTIENGVTQINLLPSTARLSSLSLGELAIEDCAAPDALLPLLQLPQLQQIQEIQHSVDHSAYVRAYRTGEEVESDVDGRNMRGMKNSVELCKSKGICLQFKHQLEG